MKIKYGNLSIDDHQYVAIMMSQYVDKEGKATFNRNLSIILGESHGGISKEIGKLIQHKKINLVRDKFITFIDRPAKATITKTKMLDKPYIFEHAIGDEVEGFKLSPDMDTIRKSCYEMVELADKESWGEIAMYGFDNNWEEVYEVISPILDNRFIIYMKPVAPANTVFISGSRSISELTPYMDKVLKSLLIKGSQILVGDCYGADSLVRKYFRERGYPRVTVYHINKCRESDNFKTIHVEGKQHMLKDRQMGRDCTVGIMLWDGKSPGTENNVNYLKAMNKYFRVLQP